MILKKFLPSRKGITVFEIVIALTVIFATTTLLRISVDFVNQVFFFRGKLEQQRQAQEVMYQIIKEVRGARYIVDVSSVTNTLVLRVYDPTIHAGVTLNTGTGEYEVTNPQVFQSASLGTITYQFITGDKTSLRWTVDYPGRKIVKDLLPNLLVPDDPNTPETEFIFNSSPSGASPPYRSVQIIFRIGLGPKKDQIKVYRSIVSLRATPVAELP